MKIIVIGGAGTIGAAVVKELSPRHEILIAGRKKGDLIVDIESEDSIRKMFTQAGQFDAVVVAAGEVVFEELGQMNNTKYHVGLNSKLMGQVNVVLIGSQFIQNRGSFTLTSGVLSVDPIHGGSSASMVNRAIEGFVMAAAIELPRGIRINAVRPTVLREAMDKFAPYFRGFDPVPASKAALAYSKSVEGLQTGQTYTVFR